MDGDYIVVLVTVPSRDVGIGIARELVERGLAACVNVIDGLRSIYVWEGKVEEDNEALMVIKTVRSKFNELRDFVKSRHPYKVPEIIALPIIDGLTEYLRWISEVVR
ncbi:divalent-cation tolerance protein CutA [Vulcanisaeta thermophila]|uniref:divalent-cation tolerance protein CutA n=1 Tax=Vulcanisaeta thermophila TaxID=867917 RepID=UPI000A01625F|nr:divalent-cation tolerance protein CutA [Vulcanisaeta thermophila]